MTKICNICGIIKEYSEFNKRHKAPDGHQPLCRDCQKKKGNERYKNEKPEFIQNVRNRTLLNKRKLDALKSTTGCKDCGIKNLSGYLYDFDHLSDKINNVSRMVSHSWENIQAEINKCEIVCCNCHRLRTYLRKHGTLDAVPPAKTKDRAFLKCMWDKLLDFKNKSCHDCNKTFHFSVMECDHRDPSAKNGEPSNLARSGPESVFEAELSKCDVVCSICHRRRSAKSHNYDDLPPEGRI